MEPISIIALLCAGAAGVLTLKNNKLAKSNSEAIDERAQKADAFYEQYTADDKDSDAKMQEIHTILNISKPLNLTNDDNVLYYGIGGPLLNLPELTNLSGVLALTWLTPVCYPHLMKDVVQKLKNLIKVAPEARVRFTFVYEIAKDRYARPSLPKVDVLGMTESKDIEVEIRYQISPDGDISYISEYLSPAIAESVDLATWLRSVEYQEYRVDGRSATIPKLFTVINDTSAFAIMYGQKNLELRRTADFCADAEVTPELMDQTIAQGIITSKDASSVFRAYVTEFQPAASFLPSFETLLDLPEDQGYNYNDYNNGYNKK